MRVAPFAPAQASGAAHAEVRAAYHLQPDRFAVILVGKDEYVAYRSAVPGTAERLQNRIDAMPMRRAGQR